MEAVIGSFACNTNIECIELDGDRGTEHASPGPTEHPPATRNAETERGPICANITEICAKFRTKSEFLGKVIVLVSFLVTALALWPTFSGAGDSRRSTLLAEWTAKKDFFELCESVCLTHGELHTSIRLPIEL